MTTESSQLIRDAAAPRAGGVDGDRAFSQQIAAQLQATTDSKRLRRAMAISSAALGALLTGMVVWILVSGREYVRDLRQIKTDAEATKAKFLNDIAELSRKNSVLTGELTSAMDEVKTAKQTLTQTQRQLEEVEKQLKKQLDSNQQRIGQMERGLDQQIQTKVDYAVATYQTQLTQSTEQAKRAIGKEGEAVSEKFADAKRTADQAKTAADQVARSIANTAAAAAEPAMRAATEAKSAVDDLAKRVESLETAGKPAPANGGDLPKKEDDKKSSEHSKSETRSNPPEGDDAKTAPPPKTEGAQR